VNRGKRTNIVWLTEEIFKKRSAQMKYHIINYMRANKVYICAQMKYFLRPNEMPMCPNEMHRGYISDFFWKQKRQTKEF
jgi:hypothetical protein